MGISNGAFSPTPYRHAKRLAFAFEHAADLTAGTYTYKVIDLPAGARLTDVSMLVEVAAVNGSGTTVASIKTDEGSPTVLLGSTAINLETQAFYNFAVPAGSGGPASAITCRKKMPAKQAINLEIVIATATAASGATGIITIEYVDEDQSA